MYRCKKHVFVWWFVKFCAENGRNCREAFITFSMVKLYPYNGDTKRDTFARKDNTCSLKD